MPCKGMSFYYRIVPIEFCDLSEKDIPKEHVVCRRSQRNCPKKYNKCKISQYCYIKKTE